jgi:hypothetical protein
MTKRMSKVKREAVTKNLHKAREVQLSTLTPKQEDFLERYYNPASDTYANAYRSAKAAGYSESYARLMRAPSVDNHWITIENYKGASGMTPAHIVGSIERIAMRGFQEKDQLKALQLLAQLQGLLVEKKVIGHVNIEQALQDLK